MALFSTSPHMLYQSGRPMWQRLHTKEHKLGMISHRDKQYLTHWFNIWIFFFEGFPKIFPLKQERGVGQCAWERKCQKLVQIKEVEV